MPIWRNPKAVQLITAVIPNVEKYPKFALIPFAVIQLFVSAHPWVQAYFYMSLIVGFTVDVSNELELMRYVRHTYFNGSLIVCEWCKIFESSVFSTADTTTMYATAPPWRPRMTIHRKNSWWKSASSRSYKESSTPCSSGPCGVSKLY